MPNRIIKESICTSDSIDHLSIEAERLFYRLIVNCDDYGVLDARIPIIKSKCFPLKSSDITDNQLKSWLTELETQQMVFFYENSGHEYLKMSSWERHQQIRAKRPKYPLPGDENSNKISFDIICNHLNANVTVIQSNPIQSNTESESNPNTVPPEETPDKPAHTPPKPMTPEEYHAALEKLEKKKFQPPTIEEVTAYCQERNKGVNPDKWFNHYLSNGWMVGKTKMKDWKAAVRTWEGENQNGRFANNGGNNGARSSGATAEVPKYGHVV